MLAQGAVAAIRSGCQMLSEGKAEIDKFKKTVEQGVGDAKAIYGQVTGLWGWIKGLFGGGAKVKSESAPVIATEPKPVAKKAKRQPEPELSYEEYQARSIHEVCENLKIFFDIQRQLKEHCRELEEQSKTTEKVADAAIDRIEIETQLISLSRQIREAMTYTPEELGLQDLYARFLKMYGQILEEQEFDRQLKMKRKRDEAWRLEHRNEILTYKMVYAVSILVGMLEVIGLYLTL
jgi:hypothetical protein